MYIGTEFRENYFVRTSVRGKTHTYSRKRTVVVLRCDACQGIMHRDKGDMDSKRLNDTVYHVCNSCDPKKFAQSKGVEARRVWDMPVSSLKTIDQLGN
jgi:hypothetical protein